MNKPRSKSSETVNGPVPRAAVGRLSLYLRQLESFVRNGRQTISSNQIGGALGITDAQVRKDLAYFGQFGHPGIGYRVSELTSALRRILGTDSAWPVALVGVGNLGRALFGYRGFHTQGFHIRYLFDSDPAKVGEHFEDLQVHHVDDLPSMAAAHKIKLAIIAVPAAAAQEVADRLVQAGIEGILNFAPVKISVPDAVRLVEVDLAIQLEQLSFLVVSGSPQEAEARQP